MEAHNALSIINSLDSNITVTNVGVKHSDIYQLLKELDLSTIDSMQIDTQTFSTYFDPLSILGVGNFGVVISAIEKQLGEACAIKVYLTADNQKRQAH